MKIITLLLIPVSLFAQSNVDQIVSQIEKNNITLSALRKTTDAQKLGNKRGITLPDPVVGYNYLWGTPAPMGNRQDINIKQTMDFPTAYRYKNQISELRNEQAELEYRHQQKAMLLQARNMCIDLIYLNALQAEYRVRVAHAQQMAQAYKRKLDAGDVSLPMYNKAQLAWLNLSQKAGQLESDRTYLQSELTRMNGGIAIELSDSSFSPLTLPADFEQWYAGAARNNPMLNRLKQESEISQKQIRLNKALSLPRPEVGYMSEKVAGEQFRGVTLGFSIPLWENRNGVKYARANARATEATLADQKNQLYIQLKSLYQKATALQSRLNSYRTALSSVNRPDLTRKALEKGEISLTEYYTEMSVSYESIDQLIELQMTLYKSVSELNSYQLP